MYIYIYFLRTHICAAAKNMCIYIYITRPCPISTSSSSLVFSKKHTGALMPEPHPMSSNKHGRSGSNSNSRARSVILGLLRDFCHFFPTKRLMLPMGKRLATETRKLCNLEKVRCWKSTPKKNNLQNLAFCPNFECRLLDVETSSGAIGQMHLECYRLKHQDTSFESQSSDC